MSINKIENIVNQFDPIDLKQMDEVSLMRRVDQKFTLPIDELLEILPILSRNYKCLEINNNRIFSYNTEYFDTKDNKMFLAHQNEKQNTSNAIVLKHNKKQIEAQDLLSNKTESKTLNKTYKSYDFGSIWLKISFRKLEFATYFLQPYNKIRGTPE